MDYLIETKKGQIDLYCAFIASRWFESIDDFIHLEMCSSRFYGNLNKFFYNPIPLTPITREFFTHLRTLFIYSSQDNQFSDDERIKAKEHIKISPYKLYYNELKQLEEWTNKKCGDILFDSEKNDWSYCSSDFNEKIIGKKQLIFLIEDTNGYLFGYYLNTEIIEKYQVDQSTDNESFLFSLNSQNKLSSMMKFEIKDTHWGCMLYKNDEDYLIALGCGGIFLYKKNYKEESYSWKQPKYFNYHDINISLCGKETYRDICFTPKRILVIQMN